MARPLAVFAAGLCGLLLCSAPADAQYFGRNKVQYQTFNFQVLHTTHFDLYYYPQERDAANLVARLAERWDARLSRFFDHELRGRQPIILYASAADFRQTNAIEGLIGEGTGGVTEALKRRVVVPMGGSLADTDHVVGHELVHAFQFDMTGADPHMSAAGAPGILGYPLWFVEGMAEYVSLGPVDAQTAMWLRDAVAHDAVPDLKNLDDPKFFPYRWGQAFWAYVGARWGDKAIASLLRSAANPRFDWTGLALQLGETPEALNADWHRAIRAAADAAALNRPSVRSTPHVLLGASNGVGRLNVGPRLSPDGRRLAFFSERDEFSIDLYVADANSGHVERRLVHSATDPHFDSLQFLTSAGAWSPDGSRLALTVLHDGRPALAILNPETGAEDREIPLPGLVDALNPAWSPDARTIVFCGSRGGFTDLFKVAVDSGALTQLTDDPFADLEPTFTPDGQSVVFVTERYSTDLSTLTAGPLRLARLDLATGAVEPIPAFLAGKHISPQVSADGRTLTFIADPDGVSNIYRMPIDGGPILQLSAVSTGVAGITDTSPALSIAKDGRMVFSVFDAAGDVIERLDRDDTSATVAPQGTGALTAALLPPRASPGGVVYDFLHDATRGLPPASDVGLRDEPYRSRLSLDLVGQPTFGASVSAWGTQFVGGMSAVFSDMLGDHVLDVSAEVAGHIEDFGGVALYINRRHRWNFGVEADASPYRYALLTQSLALSQSSATETDTLTTLRQISLGGGGLAFLPLNASQRIELSSGLHRVTFSEEDETRIYDFTSGRLLSRTDATHSVDRPLVLEESSAAFVHDTSFFGGTSPIYGRRLRLEADETVGTLHYTGLLADVRQYFMPKRPLTLAFRVLHYGRYGPGGEDPALIDLFLGFPELVHGYGYGSFSGAECGVAPDHTCAPPVSLFGSRLLVGNIELRAPLVGLFRNRLEYGPVPIEVAAFFDAGVAWTSTEGPGFLGGPRPLVRSAGGAVRVNLFGLAIVEVSAARPFDRVDHGLRWQVGLREGW